MFTAESGTGTQAVEVSCSWVAHPVHTGKTDSVAGSALTTTAMHGFEVKWGANCS